MRWLRARRGVPAAMVVLLVLTAVVALDPWPDHPLRRAWFDLYLKLDPRQPVSAPVVIVAIDEASLARHGQWPWPRNQLARLLAAILDQGPAAVGLDLLLAEPGRLSPAQWAELRGDLDPELAARLRAMESNDAILARAIGRGPVVLGLGAVAEPTGPGTRLTPVREQGDVDIHRLLSFPGLVHNLDLLEQRASGLGLLNGDIDADGMVRGVPLVAHAGGRLVPALTLELLRVVQGAGWYTVHADADGAVAGVSTGGLSIPTAPDGTFRVLFSPSLAERYLSAADVLAGRIEPDRLRAKLVLVGVTGLGIVDFPPTPVDPRMPGVEIHAQVLENIFDGTVLARPAWLPAAEAAGLFVIGLLVIAASLGRSLLPMVAAIVGGSVVLTAASWYGYGQARWLVGGATPLAFAWLLFLVVLTANLARANAERRRLGRELQAERERALRTAGELAAAERIQMGILPRDPGPPDPRYELAVTLEPAREVGGDLYDFFLLDPGQLFFVVGDVAGKGVPASLFMAITKTLWKSTALRLGHGVDDIISAANREVARDNPEMMFVTAVSGILDLDTGRLDFCIAGHDPPLVVASDGTVRHLEGVGGPPLCVMDDFPYPLERARLAAGERLCLVTDGVTEAQDPAGELYGAARLRAALTGAGSEPPAALLERVRRDVAAFCAGAPAADDLTIMVLGWRGPEQETGP